jgi:GTP-binding protein
MLIDEVIITIKAGDGGRGSASLRREKYVPKGGPDGGDGGNGGDVYIVASESTHGLANYKGKGSYTAEDGGHGGKKLSHGKNGEDLILSVPPGTRITELHEDGTEYLIADMNTGDEPVRVARAGKGGWGNWHFRSPTNQTPLEFNPGKPGQSKTLRLELQLIADVGLIGLPNAGKSTLLSVISNASPKIANYPFTTLSPNLGMVQVYDKEFVVADIPGLIEGAADGKGLGHDFLKHVLRTNVIVHLIAATEEDPEAVYQSIRKELAAFDSALIEKPEIVVMSKIDLLPEYAELHAEFVKKHKPMAISAATHTGVKELLDVIASKIV